MKLHLITIALFTLAVASCGTTDNKQMTRPSPNNSLSKTFWVLETFKGENFTELGNADREIGFKLEDDNNRISGYAGCNTFMGNIAIRPGRKINFSDIATTRMACPDLTFSEAEFLEIFALAKNYKITDGKLELRNRKRDEPVAVFRKTGHSDDVKAELIVEKYWKLKILEGEEVKMGENQEREIYFTLKLEDNRVVGFAGCNNIMGSYTLGVGNRIRFSQMATTMMACPDMEIEQEFLKVFELADNYTIVGDELLLNVGRRAPLAAFEAVYFD